MKIYRHRSGLLRALRAIQRGELTIGYVGGSITDARPGFNWPETVTRWFVEKFPKVRIHEENAAIGATGSDLAVFRAERDLIRHGCDLVFIEFAVNDYGETTEKRRRTREGLVRKLLAKNGRDLMFVYTFSQPMYAEMIADKVPASIAEFEELAEHYGIPSVWMGLYALEDIKEGRMRWEEWLPDGLHPQHRGSYSYGQAVTALLEKELISAQGSTELAAGERMPAPMNANNWENATLLPFSDVGWRGAWSLKRWPHHAWIDQVLETSAVGASLSFEFDGRGLCLGFDFGKNSSEFRYRIDSGEWINVTRDRPAWCGPSGWFRLTHLGEDLRPGRHKFDLEVTHGDKPECAGTNFRLALIGIIK
jgi:lysophospholipase L1-like esterase